MEKLVAGDPRYIGAYRVLERLGAGGTGQVYLASSGQGVTVAVKLVHRELAEQEEFRSQFRREVAAARRVGGEWTAAVLDADTETEVPWLATAYLAGPTLREVVRGSHGPLSGRSLDILAAGLAHALQDIHAGGLMHRGLKPSHVLVTTGGPRVIDFGMAHALETPAGRAMARSDTGALVDSRSFLAPEQLRGDRVTAACDVFCLGAVLAYAATGRLPFGEVNDEEALLVRIAQEEPDLSGLPGELPGLVRDCLRADPAARPTTTDVLARVGGGEEAGRGAGPGGEPWFPGTGPDPVRPDPRPVRPAAPPVRPGQPAAPEQENPTVRMRKVGAEAAVTRPPAADPEPAAPAAPVPAPPATPVRFPMPALPSPPSPYDYPEPGRGATPPYRPAPPYSPAPGYTAGPGFGPPVPPFDGDLAPDRPARSPRGTIALVAVAVMVVIGAGGAVYAFLGDGSTKDGERTRVSGTADPKPPAEEPAPPPARSSAPTLSPSPSPSSTATAGKGDVPAKYLGSWTTVITTKEGSNPRGLVIRQGTVGDTVLSLTADGPAGAAGGYHCVFAARLKSAPGPGSPLHIGPSTVTTGQPLSSCSPGTATELTILSDGRLRRTMTNGESLTYTKTD
jgi:hypothetical protein